MNTFNLVLARYAHRTLRVTLIIGGVVMVSGCAMLSSSSEPGSERTGEYRVEVRTSGKDVPDFKKALVHRFGVSPSGLLKHFDPKSGRVVLPFTGKREYDSRGGVKGVRIVSKNAVGKNTVGKNASQMVFGLRHDDLLTAVGVQHATELSDLWVLYEQLRTKRSSSVTVERDGMPHKILYFIEET